MLIDHGGSLKGPGTRRGGGSMRGQRLACPLEGEVHRPLTGGRLLGGSAVVESMAAAAVEDARLTDETRRTASVGPGGGVDEERMTQVDVARLPRGGDHTM